MGAGENSQWYRGRKQLGFGQVLGVPYLRPVPPELRLSWQPAPSPRQLVGTFHCYQAGCQILDSGFDNLVWILTLSSHVGTKC